MKKPKVTGDIVETERPPLRLDKGVLGRRPREQEVKLVWPSVFHPADTREMDSRQFPSHEHVTARYQQNDVMKKSKEGGFLGCKAFWDEVARANTILIFDPHFSPGEVRRLRDVLFGSGSITTLCIICGTVEQTEMIRMFRNLQQELTRQHRAIFAEMRPGMKSTSPPYPHDRFAVTDGELWHFGGTVGGGQKCLTAVSRGWRAQDFAFERFFTEAWEMEFNTVAMDVL